MFTFTNFRGLQVYQIRELYRSKHTKLIIFLSLKCIVRVEEIKFVFTTIMVSLFGLPCATGNSIIAML